MSKEKVQSSKTQANSVNPEQVEFTPQQAVNILIQGVQIAQSKGVYSFEDSALILKAISVFKKAAETPTLVQEETETVAK